MPNRTRTVASAIRVAFCANLVATSMAATAISIGAAHAADDCLSAPKGPAPAGAHWYYRSDHKTNRKCWYVADEAQKPRQVASQKPVTPSPQQSDAKLQPSTADARAELPAETAPTDQPALTVAATQPTPAQPADVAPDQSQRDALAAAFRAANADRVNDNNNVVIADDSVNVEPSGSDAQTEPPSRATVGQAQTAALSTTETAIGPLRTAFGWIMIGLGIFILAGGMLLGFPSARPPRQRFAETISR